MSPRRKLEIEITNRQKAVVVPRRLLRQAVRAAYAAAGGRVSVVVVDDATMAELNEQYLDHEGPTDVLAFEYAEADSPAPEDEIIVDAECALRESATRGHSVEAELVLYAVHGALHVNGYDDHKREDRRAMEERQLAIVESLGLELADRESRSTDSGG